MQGLSVASAREGLFALKRSLMSVLQQSMVGVHHAPACLAVLFFTPPHWPREEWPRSLDRHGPEPEPFVGPVLGLINPSHDQLAIKGREVRPARPLRIWPRVTSQHPGHRPGLRHARIMWACPIEGTPLNLHGLARKEHT